MHHWIVRSSHLLPNLPPISEGIAAGCPYCKAREHTVPEIGQRILFLAAGDIGQFGTRVDDTAHERRSDQFVVKMDYETRGFLRNVTRFLDLFIVEPFDANPSWAPPFSIEDVLAIQESLLRGFLASKDADASKEMQHFACWLAGTCWQRRLPTMGSEIWPMIEAHGIQQRRKEQFTALFEFGLDLLVHRNGRQPIKRKRMLPLSKGRYLSANARKHWIDHFGHD